MLLVAILENIRTLAQAVGLDSGFGGIEYHREMVFVHVLQILDRRTINHIAVSTIDHIILDRSLYCLSIFSFSCDSGSCSFP